ncbi:MULTISPECIES: CBS domain-containing protein [unclassified Cognatiyoonia]|uniref:CBS domain-containing protein n=1 Tax=unclassified Cognatiyoonia TaxID=2635977 RepID=UPI002A174BD0|nr:MULTISPECIES: CBS domain-containing protein [unclassified Cognatiyoonia]MDX8348704.1 CBS domain-containing protein [Cognatiyoonia sp. IB215446]MDX8353366.1 CBS domain-containing protein [Cognatiyoonia sp. IB215182]
MIVSQMLKTKDNPGVVSVKPSDPVTDAVKLLSAKRIGTVVVSGDGEALDGILSERDIVRELGKRGPSCLSEPVSSMMTSALTTCTPSDTALEVLEVMTNGRFRHLPVMEDGKMIGLISIGDAVKGRLAQLAMEKDALEGMIMGH